MRWAVPRDVLLAVNVPVLFVWHDGGGVGVGVVVAPVHADAIIRSRTTQPRLNIGIVAPERIEFRLLSMLHRKYFITDPPS
jgi:hypothetical protein